MRREELEALLAGTKEEPVLLHPNMGAEYRKRVANLAQVFNREENRREAADILRSLIDRIELRPSQHGKLEIDLYGDLAGILTLAGRRRSRSIKAIRQFTRLWWLRGLATLTPIDCRPLSSPCRPAECG